MKKLLVTSKKLKCRNAPGYDTIELELRKFLNADAIPTLAWKIKNIQMYREVAVIVPIYKQEDATIYCNSRVIHLLPVARKVYRVTGK